MLEKQIKYITDLNIIFQDQNIKNNTVNIENAENFNNNNNDNDNNNNNNSNNNKNHNNNINNQDIRIDKILYVTHISTNKTNIESFTISLLHDVRKIS